MRAVEQFDRRAQVHLLDPLGPVGVADEPRGVQNLHGELGEVLERRPGHPVGLAARPVRERQRDVVRGPAGVLAVDRVERPTEPLGGFDVQVGVERRKARFAQTSGEVLTPDTASATSGPSAKLTATQAAVVDRGAPVRPAQPSWRL